MPYALRDAVDRGADLSPLSQYPHEHEILFAPLSSLELQSTHVENSVLIVRVNLNINLTAMTIEKVIGKMKYSHRDLLRLIWVQIEQGNDHEFDAKTTILADLQSLDEEVAAQDPKWFNTPFNYLRATQRALQAATGSAPRFFEDSDNAMNFGSTDTFYRSLDGFLGPPNPNLDNRVLVEHCKAKDSNQEFRVPNYLTNTTSTKEYWFVAEPTDAKIQELGDQHWPAEAIDLRRKRTQVMRDDAGREKKNTIEENHRRQAIALDVFIEAKSERDEKLRDLSMDPLQAVEILCARLYTGPMYIKYNTVVSPRPTDRTLTGPHRTRTGVRGRAVPSTNHAHSHLLWLGLALTRARILSFSRVCFASTAARPRSSLLDPFFVGACHDERQGDFDSALSESDPKGAGGEVVVRD